MARSFDTAALHVFSRPHRPQASNLLVFIHGFGGSGYGTWRDTLTDLLRSGVSRCDVAVFDYVSGRRRRPLDSPRVESIVEQLVDELESLSYDSIFLVGHSMGGLIAMAAIRETHARAATSASLLSRFRAIFTLATPLAGSKWMPAGVLPVRERGVLAVHSELQRANAQFFANHVGTDLSPSYIRSLRIPHFAAKATGDRFVDRFSSTATIPNERSRTFKGGHSSFLRSSDLSSWIALQSQEVEHLWYASKQRKPPPEGLRTAFEGHPLHGEWLDSYQAALSDFALTENVRVEDLTGQKVTRPIELFVRVLRCDETTTSLSQALLQQDLSLHEKELVRALGVSAFGPAPSEGAQEIANVLGSRATRWAAATTSLAELRQEIILWLSRVHALAPIGGPITNRQPTSNWSSDPSGRRAIEES